MRKLFLSTITIFILIACSSAPTKKEEIKTVKVNAAIGEIEGLIEEDVYLFKGIPFAQPPVGELRWKAPRKLAPVSETIKAFSHKSKCTQPKENEFILDRGVTEGGEDCLYLNIFVPKGNVDISKNNYPIMFWIHGGSNIWGTGNSYDFSKLAESQKVVVITINYRLGPMGWFSSSHLRNTSEGDDRSSNFGHLDIIAALEWVQENGNSFGGDPTNVTIFGESAGGHNVLVLLATKKARGLFHKAISQSGYVSSFSEQFASEESELSSAKVFQDDIRFLTEDQQIADYLRDMPIKEVFQRYKQADESHLYSISPISIRDDIVIPKEGIYKALEDVDPSVVVVAGTNKDELNLWYLRSKYFYQTALNLGRNLKRSEENLKSWIKYRSNIWRFTGAEEPLRRMSKSNQNLYSFRFDWDEEASTILGDYPLFLGAAHGLEIPFISGDYSLVPAYARPLVFPNESKEGREYLSNLMMQYWANIAKYGDPNTFVQDHRWNKFRIQNQNYLRLDSPEYIQMVYDPVDADEMLKALESDSTLELKERCLIGWIAEMNFVEEMRGDPPFDFCSEYTSIDLLKLRRLTEGRD